MFVPLPSLVVAPQHRAAAAQALDANAARVRVDSPVRGQRDALDPWTIQLIAETVRLVWAMHGRGPRDITITLVPSLDTPRGRAGPRWLGVYNSATQRIEIDGSAVCALVATTATADPGPGAEGVVRRLVELVAHETRHLAQDVAARAPRPGVPGRGAPGGTP